jgi:hypothetical protein
MEEPWKFINGDEIVMSKKKMIRENLLNAFSPIYAILILGYNVSLCRTEGMSPLAFKRALNQSGA